MLKFVKYMFGAALVATTSYLVQDVALAGGGFSSSCPAQVPVIHLGGEFLLTAFCYDRNHNLVPTQISLGEHIANDDGRLVWRKNGGFQSSIVGTNCSLLNKGATVLQCQVYRRNGSTTLSQITLDDEIANYNGHLTVLNGF